MSKRPSISDPEFNIREIAKQMLLLEDHLTDEEKYCPDCIKKHLLMVEGLAEEALTLDTKGVWAEDSQSLAKKARRWMVKFVDGVDSTKIAGEIRVIRKRLIEVVYDPRTK